MEITIAPSTADPKPASSNPGVSAAATPMVARLARMLEIIDRPDARKVNRRVVEALVKCGAFDSLHPNRAAVWASLDMALDRAAADQRDAKRVVRTRRT